jgi:predicted dithiol-disulfide oxidoreductase (DUF899 family)
MRHQERVAEMRRQLPQGPENQDYAFEEGPADLNAADTPVRTIRMSQLFTAAFSIRLSRISSRCPV